MVQQPANPCSTAAESATVTTTTEAANPGSGNLTATTAAATPCPEKCEHTQNTGECSAGDQICFNTLLSSANKIPKYSHLRDFNDNLNENLINFQKKGKSLEFNLRNYEQVKSSPSLKV